MIIDEAQYVPDIFSSVQVISDNNERLGRFILSGSQNFLLLKNIKQSLAGRVGIIKLPTLTFSEIYKYKPKLNIDEIMVKGSYPRIYAYDINHSWYYENYLDTYITRDAKDLLDVKNIYSFRKLLNVLASQTGQLLNYNSTAKMLNIDQRTVKSWINILCASYVCFLVTPFYRNINKRLTKTPKLYFYDTGLLSYLLEIESADDYNHSIYKGQIFENFIIFLIQKNIKILKKIIKFIFIEMILKPR